VPEPIPDEFQGPRCVTVRGTSLVFGPFATGAEAGAFIEQVLNSGITQPFFADRTLEDLHIRHLVDPANTWDTIALLLEEGEEEE
jgi:hypothetical protein